MKLIRSTAALAFTLPLLPAAEAQDAEPVVIIENDREAFAPYQSPKWWFRFALEAGASRAQSLPPLVLANGAVAMGNEDFGPVGHTGFSISGGAWLDDMHINGVDASLYVLGESQKEWNYFGPAGQPVFRPGRNEANGRRADFALAGMDVGIGSFQILGETRYDTGDVNYRRSIVVSDAWSLDALAGYRYAFLREGLHLYNKRMGGDGFLIRTKDHILAENYFNGGQIGLASEWRSGRTFVNLTGKLAVGAVSSWTNVEGAFRVNSRVEPFGYYSRPAVAGERSHCDFAVMPMFDVAVGRQITEHMRIFVGYSFQYLSRVTRPVNVIDPAPAWNGYGQGMTRDASRSDFWVSTMNLGMMWQY